MVNPLELRQFSSFSSDISLFSSVVRDPDVSQADRRAKNALLESYCGMVWRDNSLQPLDMESSSQQSFRISLFTILEEIMTYDICHVKMDQIVDLLSESDAQNFRLRACIDRISVMQEHLDIKTLLDLILTAYPLNLAQVCELEHFKNQKYCVFMRSLIEEMTKLPSDIGDRADRHIVFLQTVANLIVPLVSFYQTAFLLQVLGGNDSSDFFSAQFQLLNEISPNKLVINDDLKIKYIKDVLDVLPVLFEQKEKLLQVFSFSPNMNKLHLELINSYFMLLSEIWFQVSFESREKICRMIDVTVKKVFLQFPHYEQALNSMPLEDVNGVDLLDTYLQGEFWKGELGMKV